MPDIAFRSSSKNRAASGIAHSFTTPWFSGEDAADLIVTTSAGNVYITAVGYEV